MSDSPNKRPSKYSPVVLLFIAFAIIFLLWIGFLAFATDAMNRGWSATAGQMGDTFGMMNALLSGLTLIAAGAAVIYQRIELHEAREEKAESDKAREESEKAQRESQRLLASQAQAMLAAARLNAADSLSQVAMKRMQNTYFTNVTQNIKSGSLYEMNKLVQYQQAVLWDIDDVNFNWNGVEAVRRSLWKKYAIKLVQGCKLDIELNFIFQFPDSNLSTVDKLFFAEFQWMAGQAPLACKQDVVLALLLLKQWSDYSKEFWNLVKHYEQRSPDPSSDSAAYSDHISKLGRDLQAHMMTGLSSMEAQAYA